MHSTAEYDCGEKLEYYKLIPSLREVMLVDHEQRRVLIWRTDIAGAWRGEEITAGTANSSRSTASSHSTISIAIRWPADR